MGCHRRTIVVRPSLHKQIRSSRVSVGLLPRFNVFLALAALAAMVSYVFLVNDVSTKGYEIQTLKQTVNSIDEALVKTKSQTANEQSMRSITQRLERHSFVPEGSVEYARPASPVALGPANE